MNLKQKKLYICIINDNFVSKYTHFKNSKKMKRPLYITWLCLFVFSAISASAKYTIDNGAIYRLTFNKVGKCGVAIGSLHSSQAPLQHMQNGNWDDLYWVMEKKGDNAYALRNHQTSQYITFDTIKTRVHYNLGLTDEIKGDSSLWRFDSYGDNLVLTSLADTSYKLTMWSGSLRVGAQKFSGTPSSFCYFMLYNRYDRHLVSDEERLKNVVNYFDYVRFDEVQPIYDNFSNQLLLPVKREYAGKKSFRLKLSLESGSNYSLYINNVRRRNGDWVGFSNYKAGSTVTLVARADTGKITETKMTITFMPVIEITGTDFKHDSYSPSTFRITDADFLYNNDSTYYSKMRYRGATSYSSGRDKKGYGVKLYAPNGEKLDRQIHGLRNDNFWVLDPMALDVGRVRNPSAFKIWQKIKRDKDCYYSDKEPNRQKSSRGFFAEVLLNGTYNGMYNVMEHSDRKQFKLKKFKETDSTKTVRGLLYKSKGWNLGVRMMYTTALPSYKNTSATWDGWAGKYPDPEDGEPFDWGPLWRAVQFVSLSKTEDFNKKIWTYFDRPVMIDFFLFVEFLYGYDNVRNNVYYMVYNAQKDSMLTYAPWDMDCDIGRGWGGSIGAAQSPEIDVDDYYLEYFGIYRRMVKEYPNFHNIMAERYAELRTYAFNPDTLLSIYNGNFDFYAQCGCDTREYNRWHGHSGLTPIFAEDRKYINDWIPRRIATLDKKYGFDATGVAAVKPAENFRVSPSPAGVYVHADEDMTLNIYDTAGRIVKRARISAGGTTIPLNSGIYIIGKQKYLVK